MILTASKLQNVKNYEEVLLIGDFNTEDSEPDLSEFLYESKTQNIV